MYILLKYQIIQFIHFWRNLGLRVQIEILFLFITFYTYFVGKFIYYFSQLLSQPNVTPWGLSGFIVHILLLFSVSITPFIYFNLIPRQTSITTMFILPLSSSQVLISLLFYYFKYELLVLLLLAPVFTAFLFTIGFLPSLYALLIFISFSILSVILIFHYSAKSYNKFAIILKYFLVLAGYAAIYSYFYWFTDHALSADCLILLFSIIILRRYWRTNWKIWDGIVGRWIPRLDRSTKVLSGFRYSDLNFIKPESIRPIWSKDLLSQLRNKHYIRLKLLSLFVFITALFIVKLFFSENLLSALSVFTIILIWEHYAHQFNEKYSAQEPRYFYKVQPIRFSQLICAKFLSEFLYIIIIVLVLFLFLIIEQISFFNMLLILGSVVLISAFILYLMILVRILFHDNPRFAGYAYHLMLIFSIVMIFNFYLVGPLVTIGILLYLNFKSYRQFIR